MTGTNNIEPRGDSSNVEVFLCWSSWNLDLTQDTANLGRFFKRKKQKETSRANSLGKVLLWRPKLHPGQRLDGKFRHGTSVLFMDDLEAWVVIVPEKSVQKKLLPFISLFDTFCYAHALRT